MNLLKVAALLWSITSAPQAHAFTTGGELLEWCNEHLKGSGRTDTNYFNSGVCLGYIDGFTDMAGLYQSVAEKNDRIFFCLPDGVTLDQLARVAVQYLANNPRILHLPVYVPLATAYKQAFPCK